MLGGGPCACENHIVVRKGPSRRRLAEWRCQCLVNLHVGRSNRVSSQDTLSTGS